jgi:uncharacterized integral membrane protein
MNIKMITGIILALIVVIFALQNFQIVKVSFLFWILEMSKSIMIFLLFGLGLITGLILGKLK